MGPSILLFLMLSGCSFAYNFTPHSLQNATELSKSILYICHSHIAPRTSSIALSAEVQVRQAQHYFNDFAERLLKSLDRLKIQLDFFQYHHPKSWDFFNILLVDSAMSYRKINPGEKTSNCDHSEYYIVVLRPIKQDDYLDEMEDIFAYCWSYYIVNVSIMLEDTNGTVQTFTYFPFTEGECFSTAPVEVKGSEFLELFPPKTLDFHNCTLVGALWNVPPYLGLNRSAAGLNRFHGMEGHLLSELAKKMNFSLSYVTPANDMQRGRIYSNGTVTGAVELLKKKIAHLSLGSFRCTLERSTVLSPSHSFYQTMQVYTVKARTEAWTTFDIITYPFDFYIWTLILVIMIIVIVLSFVLKKYHLSSLYFIFGDRNSGSVINVVSAWLGSPVVPEPRRNFARYLLSNRLLMALVLRNAYQGLLFDFLRSNLAKLPPDTSQELAQRHYSLIVNLASYDTFSGVSIIRDGHLNVLVRNITDGGGYLILEQTNERIATATPKDFLSYHVMTTKKYGVFHVLKETIFSQQICIYFTKHSFLTYRINQILMNIRSFGLIDFWASQYINDAFIEENNARPSGGVPMTMSQLLGVFQILSILLCAAAIVFIAEIMSIRLRFLRQWLE